MTCLLASALSSSFGTAGAQLGPSRGFSPSPFELGAGAYRLYDLGVVDYNSDGHLDVYSTNHTARAALRPGIGTLSYPNDVIGAVGLDSAPGLPGVEEVGLPADRSAPGLYLYRTAPGKLVAEVVIGSEVDRVEASLTFYGNVRARTSGPVEVVVDPATDSVGRPTNVVTIAASSSASVELTLELAATNMSANVTTPTDPRLIRLGVPGTTPSSPVFSWLLRDRHGVAWPDVGGSDAPDMLIANGGLKAHLDDLPGLAADELLLGREGGFDAVEVEQLSTGHCRSRSPQWADVDNDGVLDLFITCEDDPARLLLGTPGGGLVDNSRALPATLDGDVPVRWVDVDGDRVPELIAPTAAGLCVFGRESDGAYQRRQRVGPPAVYSDASLADVDNNGTPDLYYASSTGSRLLLGAESGFRSVRPGRYGLPGTAERAAWVDVDNNGRTDLFVVPGGLYLQRKTGRFGASGLLGAAFPENTRNQNFAFFDGDSDGDRDLITAYESDTSYVSHVTMLENQAARGHWLEVDLRGPSGNASALGAEVHIVADNIQSSHWVGESENAKSSQGHFRIYRGLGSAPRTDSIEVRWPDGTTQLVPNDGDRRLVVVHPEASGRRSAG